ncbi:SDR family oxidoreductase [Croceitalea rosinachiae]|uniref:SDR family oxidoreductase n=1 Tax=Croceitalea rosinachiae TaxID=3075596 RepID=A0ABU3AAW7_9FLAO|nr:SDR family oxidoreductase [Croceitalea sp. F388]MDT0607309.1 SDR family oxidoreductase [Croceitalea sp. F388]
MNKKVVLITGGSSGIGKATGIFLKSKGFTVYGTTRSLDKHKDFADFQLLELDVKDDISVNNAIQTILKNEEQIDILINNAGVGITGPVEETPIVEINKAFDTNFNGPIRMVQAVLPQMRKQQSGLIINITSIAGYMGLPFRGIYSATKGALELATEALRMEVREFGVKISNLAPGDFATNIAAGRYHSPVLDSSPYKAYGKSLDLINEDVNNASNPIEVAKKVLMIINTTDPKVHYKVGSFMQKFSLILKKILPDKRYERLLLKHYKL